TSTASTGYWRSGSLACRKSAAERAGARPPITRYYGPVTSLRLMYLLGGNVMIIEMRTYRMKPGSIPEVENRFAEGLKERTKVSPLGAFFHTEVGPLNRIIHCWPYDDLAHRTKVRSQSIPGWPPKLQEFMEEMESKIVIAAPFS